MSSSTRDDMDVSQLEARLARLSTVEEKVEAVWSWSRLPRSRMPTTLDPGGNNPSDPAGVANVPSNGFSDLINADPELGSAFFASVREAVLGSAGGGPVVVDYAIHEQPCANVDAKREFACGNPGSSLCGSCKLVYYCSKVGLSSFERLISSNDCVDLPNATLEDPQTR